jgi:hypothetical protein
MWHESSSLEVAPFAFYFLLYAFASSMSGILFPGGYNFLRPELAFLPFFSSLRFRSLDM